MRWRRGLPSWVEVVPVELPGRGVRFGEAFARDFDALVSQLCSEHARHFESSCVLFGHSMGALLAYGMAERQRVHGGRLPQALLVSASPAPSRRDTGRFAGMRSDEALVADLRRQGGVPQEVLANAEMLRLTLDMLSADYQVCGSYAHKGAMPLPLPVQVLAGREDDIAPEQIEAWGRETSDWFAVEWFDGGHFFIRPHEAQVLKVVAEYLARVRQAGVHVADPVA